MPMRTLGAVETRTPVAFVGPRDPLFPHGNLHNPTLVNTEILLAHQCVPGLTGTVHRVQFCNSFANECYKTMPNVRGRSGA